MATTRCLAAHLAANAEFSGATVFGISIATALSR